MNEFYFIGKIISSGKDGSVKVELVPGFVENLKKIDHILLDFWGQKKIFKIEEILNLKNSIFLKFKNFDAEREISLLIDKEIFISLNDINSLNLFVPTEQSYLGYKVYRDQELLGIVTDFFQAPANPVLEISDETGKEILIPLVQDLFDKIDSEKKELMLKVDYGFYDDET